MHITFNPAILFHELILQVHFHIDEMMDTHDFLL